MSRYTIRVDFVGGRDHDITDSKTIQLHGTDNILRKIREIRNISDYDIFRDGNIIPDNSTPLSLGMNIVDAVEAYKIATEEESKEMKEHLRKTKYDPTKFKYYMGGDLAHAVVYDKDILPEKKKDEKVSHNWGKGKRLGKR